MALIIGNEFDNNLFGTESFDDIRGLGGNDTLRGFGGLDRLDGGVGADLLDGGAGIDTVVYEASKAGVTVFIDSGGVAGGDAEGDTFVGIENVKGSQFDDGIVGNEERNVINGFEGNDTLKGGGGADFLDGFIGDDLQEGGDGNDQLRGNFGADTLDGGAGIDTAIYVAPPEAEGVTVDLGGNVAPAGGEAAGDTLIDIENVVGTSSDDTLIGNDGANELDGGEGNDTLKGAGGADTLIGQADNDFLLGGEGNDTLDGGAFAATMQGGGGSDTYNVTAGDVVDESVFGGGIDTVKSSFSFSLASSAVRGDVVNLVLEGGGDIDGGGNALANTLVGNSGANNLNGNSGADRMIGRGGDDNYVVNEVGDVVDETVNGLGLDGVFSLVSLSLSGPNVRGSVENLRLATGTLALNAAGNGLGNLLEGNDGRNDLMGLGGDDTLTGDGGKDTLVFNAALNAITNVDTITDFTVPDDTMRLENAFMPGLATGTLAAGAFRIGAAAGDVSDRIVYDDDTGGLFFDSDGTGAAAAVRFATLDAGLAMTNADFLVV